jgi:glycosyltransferase involved in cell wall biosynthesis
MNILFLTDGIPPYVTGGMQKHSYIVSKLLSENKCKVTLVHCGFLGENNFNEDYSKNFTKEQLSNLYFVFIPFKHTSKLPGHYISDSKSYSKEIDNFFGINIEKFDLIYAQGFTGWHFLNNSQHIPVIVNLHGFEMFQKASNFKIKLEHQLLRPIVKDLVKKADYVLSFGGKIDDILLKLKVDESKIIQQSNGIEQNWIKEDPLSNQRIKTFTFIGRHERRKGIEELTEALEKVIKTNLEFQFNFIGPIPESQQINNSSITYYGELKDATQIKSLLDQSDYLISPSYAEGMPTVILEAMARGNAIIATDVGATSKLLAGNGFLIHHDSSSILDALEKAIQIDNNSLLAFKEKSIEKVKNEFIWEKVIQQKLKAFKEIIANAKKSFA